jgi:hypothetical protein
MGMVGHSGLITACIVRDRPGFRVLCLLSRHGALRENEMVDGRKEGDYLPEPVEMLNRCRVLLR